MLLQKASYSHAPISLHFRLAEARGAVDSFTSPDRKALLATLERYLGKTVAGSELRRIARRHLQALRKAQLTTVWPQIHDFAGVEAIQVEGLERLDEALAGGKGAILVSTHFGYVRMIKPVLRSRGRRPLLVANLAHAPKPDSPRDAHQPRRPPRAGSTQPRLQVLRRRSDERWQQIGGDISPGLNLRPCIDALERNETLIILADGRRAQAVHALQVADIEISFATGAVSIARGTGAALLPTFVVDEPGRTGPASLRLVIHPPLEQQITEDRQADLRENLRRFADVFEQQIRAHPHNFNWAWVRNGAFESPRLRRQQDAGSDAAY